MNSEADTQPALAVESTIRALGSLDTVTSDASSADGTRPGASLLTRERYQTRGRLGEGGMGVVDRAWDADLMRDVAIKQLRAHRRGDPARLREFLWEARVTAHLDHPNIVPIHELGLTPDEQLYFTMKYVRGESLEQVLEALSRGDEPSRYTLPRRLRLFLQICQAIAFAHSRGILHRDLKPANIMLGEHGEVLVMDWGIAVPLAGVEGRAFARLLPEGVRHEPERVSGTPLYMSPEQARGERLDVRSDVYTLGVILYELVALTHAYQGTNLPAILLEVSEGDFVPLAQTAPDTSVSLRTVIEKAMAAAPEERYASVAALAEDVETVLDGGTPVAENASAIQRVGRFYVREKNPYVREMRVIDVDLLMLSSFAFGGGIALMFAGWIASWWWALIVVSILIFAFPAKRWLATAKHQTRKRGDEPTESSPP